MSKNIAQCYSSLEGAVRRAEGVGKDPLPSRILSLGNVNIEARHPDIFLK